MTGKFPQPSHEPAHHAEGTSDMMHNPIGALGLMAGGSHIAPANARSRGTHKKTAKLIQNLYYTMPIPDHTSFSETLRIIWTGVLIYLWYASLDHLPKVLIKWSWTSCPAAVVAAPIREGLKGTELCVWHCYPGMGNWSWGALHNRIHRRGEIVVLKGMSSLIHAKSIRYLKY